MSDIQIVVSATNVNTFLKIKDELFNIYRVDLTTGIIRVAQAKTAPQTALRPLENLKEYGVTFDGVVCKIAETKTCEEMGKIIEKELVKELKYISNTPVITTDGYQPCLKVRENSAIGVKRTDDGYEIYNAFKKITGIYHPLVTDQCYFNDSFRLMMPVPQMLQHVLTHLGWLADPYDWEKFEFADQKKWVELPPMS